MKTGLGGLGWGGVGGRGGRRGKVAPALPPRACREDSALPINHVSFILA